MNRLTIAIRRVPPPVLGMGLMGFASIMNMVMASLLKDLVHELPVFEIAFFRHLFGTLMLTPLLLRPGANPFRTQHIGMHCLRAAFNIVAIIAYFSALGLIPLTQVTALGFTSPLFTSVLAVFILGEAMRTPRIVGLILGLAGALIILRPGVEEVSLGAMLALGSAASWAGAMTCIKVLSRTDSAVAIAFYAAFLQLPMAFILALFVWQWPSWDQIGLLLIIAAIGTVAQLSISQAFREADATVILPVDFTKLIWASILGYLMFSEIPDPWAWVGGTVVFAGVLWVAYNESKDRKARAAAT